MNWHLFPLFALASFLVTGPHGSNAVGGLRRDGVEPVASNAAVVSLRAGTLDCQMKTHSSQMCCFGADLDAKNKQPCSDGT
jgi:hypothetical protein